jgi:glycosyltransferase involved in cell wall biosynthesis
VTAAVIESQQRRQPNSPSIGIVIGGRFVGFDIARALARRSALAGIVTAYPKAPWQGIAPSLLRWNPILGFREAFARRLHRGPNEDHNYRYAVRFARWASRRLPDADVMQLWTGYALESIVVARKRGALTVALRGSAHIRTQMELIREEFERFGLAPPRTDGPLVQRECEEYDAADIINVISTFAMRTFLARGFHESRLILTPLAVDIEEVVSAAPRRRRSGPLRVLFLGNVSLQKGVHYLLEAAHALGERAVTVSLVGGVSSDGKEVLRRLSHNSEWKGSVPRKKLRQVFAEHDVLVLPSVQDGFGAVICEAMAAGLPVIATENTGGPDVVRDGVDGLIVPAQSSTALREALEQFVADPGRVIEMGASAAAAMVRLRKWDHFAIDMLDQYGRARATRTAAK